ncbi:MAG TPA: GDSL-type esterase/lipase family protein [Candidatus Binatia bacterium]|nr:GDSL-type esterase/lipase family protein [Candidatus Binatia bacterium]
MRVAVWISAIGALFVGFFLMMKKHSASMETDLAGNTTHVVLIGASIGQAWHLAEWPGRVKVTGFSAESVPAWQFDKSVVLEEVLMRPARKFHPTRTYLRSLFQAPPRKPDLVILKECSSYFPGDLSIYQRSIQDWVSRLQGKQIKVILATVVPVTRSRAGQDPGKQEGLLNYNEWVRGFAGQHGLDVLDLEAALRSNDSDKYLREDFAAKDGSHLNSAAYTVLDQTLRTLLCEKHFATQDSHAATAVN